MFVLVLHVFLTMTLISMILCFVFLIQFLLLPWSSETALCFLSLSFEVFKSFVGVSLDFYFMEFFPLQKCVSIFFYFNKYCSIFEDFNIAWHYFERYYFLYKKMERVFWVESSPPIPKFQTSLIRFYFCVQLLGSFFGISYISIIWSSLTGLLTCNGAPHRDRPRGKPICHGLSGLSSQYTHTSRTLVPRRYCYHHSFFMDLPSATAFWFGRNQIRVWHNQSIDQIKPLQPPF